MSVTPEYELALRLDNLSDVIADCAIWRAIVAHPNPESWDVIKAFSVAGAGTAAAAKARISWERADESQLRDPDGVNNFDPEFWPRIILADLRDSASKVSAFSWEGTADFELQLEIPIPKNYQDRDHLQDAVIYHRNVCGLFRSQLLTESQNVIQIQSIAVDAIDHCDPDQVQGNAIMFCRFLLTLGTWEA